jgi:hypothetical protein
VHGYSIRRLLIGRFAANLRAAKRVDICFYDERGIEQHRLIDIPINNQTSNVAYQESITFAKAAPTTKIMARLVSIDDAGGERLLGEYTFNHTRSLPGPGGW